MAPVTQSPFTPDLVAYVEQESDHLVRDKATVDYICYQKHFAHARSAINSAFEGSTNTNALILGVGAAQDIDLHALATSFERIRLVDIDLRQTREALERQVPEDDLRAKFELEEADLSGVFPELSAVAEQLVAQEDLTYNEFVDRILDLLPTLKPAAFPYQQTESSFVCSCLVSTQLVSTMLGYLNRLSQKKYNKPFEPSQNRSEEFDHFLTSVIGAHLYELSVLVSPSGRLYYADHFTVKGVVQINHPQGSGLEDFSQVLGENGFAFTHSLAEMIEKVFTVVSKQKWGWAIPIRHSKEVAEVTEPDGTTQRIPIKVTEFREYQVSSYVLQRPTFGL